MKKEKKLLTLILVSVLALSLMLCGCSSSNNGSGDGNTPSNNSDANNTSQPGDKVYDLRLATDMTPENHIVAALEDTVAAISEKTGGNVNITIYPGGQLGSYEAVYTQVMAGDIDMCISPLDPNYDGRLNLFLFPALIQGFDDFKTAMFPGSYLWDLLTDIESDVNIKLLGINNCGFMGIGTNNLNTTAFADLVSKDVQKDALLRIPPQELYNSLMAEMGYKTTTIAYADLYPALQSGVADGWIGGSAFVNWESFRDVIDYFIDCQVINEIYPSLMNMDLYNELPEDYRAVIEEEFLAMATRVADEREAQETQALADLADVGVTIISPTNDELTDLFDRIRTNVWPQLADLVGPDLLKEAAAQFGVEAEF